MTKKSLKYSNLVFLLLCSSLAFTQNSGVYKTDVFQKIDTLKDVKYGQALNIKGEIEALLLDIYLPSENSESLRPLLIGIHGGGFVNGNKAGGFPVTVCKKMVKRGWVTASINYRKGIESPKSDTSYFEAMMRAVQDAKAAVRFFRKNAELYRIDTSKIYLIGSSAGSMTALNVAYLDASEVPNFINLQKSGTLEGNSGNEGYSSRVHGVINSWGAMTSTTFINKGDVPIYSVHGTADKTVPYDDSYAYHGFGQGSKKLHERAVSLGIKSVLHLIENEGHPPKNQSELKIVQEEISEWLNELVTD